jgi:hypothetical protein
MGRAAIVNAIGTALAPGTVVGQEGWHRLCHAAGGKLEQIQGHMSIQTTERYLDCKQRIRSAANDRIGIEPPA